jgi:peptide/nickel transport system substrate-binding protein
MSNHGRMSESQMKLGNKIIDDFANGRLSRRQLVQKGGAVGMSMTLIGSIIAGCGGDDSGSGSSTSVKPKRGGILQISYNAAIGTENLDPALVFAGNDALYINNVYDQLVRLTNDFIPKPQLATKWTPNADGSEWTFELRPNVQFSDGTPFTSKDVKHTFTRILDAKVGSGLYGALSVVLDPAGIETPDDLKVIFKLTAPDASWPITISAKQTGIVKDGTKTFTVKNSTGTGPFMFKSFKAGQSFEPEILGCQLAIPRRRPDVGGVRARDAAAVCDQRSVPHGRRTRFCPG